MTTNDPANSVHDEQFDADKKAIESMGEETNVTVEKNSIETDDVNEAPKAADYETIEAVNDSEKLEGNDSSDDELKAEEPEETSTAADELKAEEPEETFTPADELKAEEPEETFTPADELRSEETEETGSDNDASGSAEPEGDDTSAEHVETSGESVHDIPELINYEDIVLPPVDYSGYTRKELVDTLALIVENRPPSEIQEDVSRIKELFYKKTKVEIGEKRQKFVKDGGAIEDFVAEPDELENEIKISLEVYRTKKNDYNKIQESEKYDNLKRKQEIIEHIKELVNREESINKTFQEFRNLQNEWRATGIVPQAALKDLWESYHHSVEMFYDYIKINRELRDLDLKKNLEAKIVLCEKAEELFLEPNPVNAFRSLQDYHNQWREIGPVSHESKNEVWERFREATSKINKRHHEFFEKQKDEQKRNLDAKIVLCEKAEEIANSEVLTFNDFKEKSDAILECQKLWRTLGFAPKKYNNKIYLRFRAACDKFFEKKRTFFAESKEVQMKNLQLKTDLCIQAETLQESTEWKESTDTLIRLQKEWKEIGPVPKKYSEKVWKRFRKACDTFFARKSEYFAGRNTSYEDNLTAKLAIIEELEAFVPTDDMKAGFEVLKDIQKRWAEIGYVPFNKKEEISKKYKDALNKQFDRLKLDDEDKNILKFRNKVDSAMSNPRSARKVRNEREKYYSKIKQLESDIVLWENNIGFFAKSSNADTMIKEVEEKIAEAKRTIKMLEEKVKVIDKTMLEEE
jgi:hypothetical protein